MNRTRFQIALSERGLKLVNVASALGVDKATVTRWSLGRIPAERVADVERVTGIGRYELRPDLFAASGSSGDGGGGQGKSFDMVNAGEAA
jgi:DNA-binding transcriptional regulator YdaS (Cro superfamily)